jgi:hypothetical protein
MRCQADQWVHQVNIQSPSSWSDCNTQTILDMVSGWPMGTQSEYSVTVQLIWLQHPDNIWYAVKLIDRYTESIFNQCPADLTATSRQYWMYCQADQWVHWVNIQSLSGWSNCNTHTIFDVLLGWSMGTPSKYSVTVRLIQLQHPYNIWCAVRLIDGYTEWIFSQYPAHPTVTPGQYWIWCQADQ